MTRVGKMEPPHFCQLYVNECSLEENSVLVTQHALSGQAFEFFYTLLLAACGYVTIGLKDSAASDWPELPSSCRAGPLSPSGDLFLC